MTKSPDYFDRAEWCMFGQLAIFMSLGALLANLGYEISWLILAFWMVNLVTAWHFGRAAKQMGKSPWLWGTLAAVTPSSLVVWVLLRLARLERNYS